MNQDIFDMASQYRALMKEMRYFISGAACECQMSEEYLDYENEMLEKFPDPLERVAYQVFNIKEFENFGIEKECARCLLLEKYIEVVGEDADNLEREEYIKNIPFDERTAKLIRLIFGPHDET